MYVYTPGQWALLFFFYCFCGWVWESCYVSAKQRHWVNRGFLHGPLLPIYGSGAIIILFATLPVADNFCRYGAGICGRRRNGAAFQGPLLGLHQAAL